MPVDPNHGESITASSASLRATGPGSRLGAAAGWLVFSSLLLGIVYLFYFTGYRVLIANNSSSSTVELVRRKMLVSPHARTLAIGSSVVAEGFPASAYSKLSGDSVPALNLGIPSGQMFLYEKILNMALADGLHPQAVILMVTPDIFSFSADPYYDQLKNDLNVLKVEVEWRDIPRLQAHSRTLLAHLDYSGPILLRPALYSADLRDFVSHPIQRVKDSRFVYGWLNSLTAPERFPEPDHPFSVCQAGPLGQLRQRIELERANPASPLLADLERVWLGYEGRAFAGERLTVDPFELTRLRSLLHRFAKLVPHVFLVPAPFFDPDFIQQPAAYRAAAAASFQKVVEGQPTVHLLAGFPVGCELMLDTVHLNRKGGEQFAAYLHQQVESVLAVSSN